MKYSIKSTKQFYIGDPCYVLPKETYDTIWGSQNNYKSGTIEVPNQNSAFAVVETGKDGYFFGKYSYKGQSQSRHDFDVDSGTIAIIPLELCEGTPQDWNSFDACVAEFEGEVSIELSEDHSMIFISWDECEVIIFLNEDDEDDDCSEMPWDYSKHFE